jgi:hypothetical protein
MQAAAHGGLKGLGPSPEVAEEFIHKTPPAKRSMWSNGKDKKKKKS